VSDRLTIFIFFQVIDQRSNLKENLPQKIKMEGIDDDDLEVFKNGSFMDLMRGALKHCDAIIYGSAELSEDYIKMAEETGKPILAFQDEESYIDAYNAFYDSMIED